MLWCTGWVRHRSREHKQVAYGWHAFALKATWLVSTWLDLMLPRANMIRFLGCVECMTIDTDVRGVCLSVCPSASLSVTLLNSASLYKNGWVSLTSHSTLYRSFRGRFVQARWPNQQRQSTERSQLATEIGFSSTRTTPLCYNMN